MSTPKPSFDPEALFSLPAGFGGGARMAKTNRRSSAARLLGRPSFTPKAAPKTGGLSLLALRSSSI